MVWGGLRGVWGRFFAGLGEVWWEEKLVKKTIPAPPSLEKKLVFQAFNFNWDKNAKSAADPEVILYEKRVESSSTSEYDVRKNVAWKAVKFSRRN